MKLTKKILSPRKEPNQERSKETVDVILRATAHILEKEGFEKASTNKIAQAAGVSIGSLYQYFPSKESILAFMTEHYMKDQLQIIEKLLKDRQSNDLKETIRTVVFAMIESKRKNQRFTKIFAQKIFSLNQIGMLNRMDDHTVEIFRKHLEPFESQMRTENLDMAFYMAIQCVKMIPVTLLFQDKYKIDDPKVTDEIVLMVYQYLKRDK